VIGIIGVMLLLLIAIGLMIAAWHDWLRQDGRWASPRWRGFLAATSLILLTISFAIYVWILGFWILGYQKNGALFGGTLIGMHPWSRIAAWGSIASLPLALIGKKGVRFFVVSAALVLQFSIFAAVMAD
jgi:hypothetical protein